MMNLQSAILLLMIGTLFTGIAQAQSEAPVLISTDWLAEHLDDDDLVILHVAMAHDEAPNEFIPGARLIDYHALENEVNGIPIELPPVEDLVDAFRRVGVDNTNHVVVYGSGPAHLAARVFMTLEYLGHRGKTSVLDGGLERWTQENRPIVAQGAEGLQGSFEAHISDEVLVSADDLEALLDDPHLTLIDARPERQYAPGYIPGAYNLFWRELLVSDDEPRLKDLAAVQARFHEAGASKDGVVVHYCQIGMRASYTYLVSRHLGYDTRFYDGSWSEWSRQPTLPHEKKTSKM